MLKHKEKLYPIITLLLTTLLWQTIVTLKDVPGYILPSPLRIMEAFRNDFSILVSHTWVTLLEAFIGFGIAILLAIILAILMDSFSWVRKSIYPILVISQTVPTIAIAPLFIIWFGFGMLPKIVLVILVCFFPIVISLMDSFSKVEKDYLNLFQMLEASRLQTLIHLKLPYSLVNFFSGLKIAATYMIMAAVIGEWLGGDKGIGVYMVRAKSAYALDKVFASIFIIVFVSILIIYVIDVISKKIIRWK